MQTFSYHKCYTCIVNSCCSEICKKYRCVITKRFGITFNKNGVSLYEAENTVLRLVTSRLLDIAERREAGLKV